MNFSLQHVKIVHITGLHHTRKVFVKGYNEVCSFLYRIAWKFGYLKGFLRPQNEQISSPSSYLSTQKYFIYITYRLRSNWARNPRKIIYKRSKHGEYISLNPNEVYRSQQLSHHTDRLRDRALITLEA
jgi:hypothetical protein